MADNHDRIELRSEKVRKIISDVPTALVRWGIVIIAAIFAALILVPLCVEYPYGNGESIFQHIICLH